MYSLEYYAYGNHTLLTVGTKEEVLKEIKSWFMRGSDFRDMVVTGWSCGKSNFHVSGRGCNSVEYFLRMIGE